MMEFAAKLLHAAEPQGIVNARSVRLSGQPGYYALPNLTLLSQRRNSPYKSRYISFLRFQRLQDIPAVALLAWRNGVGLQ